MAGQKNITVLEIQIKDLQTSLELTGSKERKTSQMSIEANRECRELERELMDLRIENTRMADGLEKKTETQHKVDPCGDIHPAPLAVRVTFCPCCTASIHSWR